MKKVLDKAIKNLNGVAAVNLNEPCSEDLQRIHNAYHDVMRELIVIRAKLAFAEEALRTIATGFNNKGVRLSCVEDCPDYALDVLNKLHKNEGEDE